MTVYVPPPGTYRVTLSLPAEMAVSLNRIAKRFRMSQSALLALLLEEPLQSIDRLSALLPMPDQDGKVSSDQVRRLRGASGEELRKAVRAALEAAQQVDPAPGLGL